MHYLVLLNDSHFPKDVCSHTVVAGNTATQQQLCVVCMFATLLKKFENTYLYYLN